MFDLLPVDDYAKVKPFFTDLDFNLIITAVFEGTSPGKIYVDDLANPTSCFLDSAEGRYVLGNTQNEGFNAGLKAFFHGKNHVVLECNSADWPPVFQSLFEGRMVQYPRRYYVFDNPTIDGTLNLPEGFTLEMVDAAFLERDLKNMDEVVEGYINNWNSREAFLENGFGLCVVHEDTVVSWCMTDCISGTHGEIGIHTDPHYQKRGFASAAVRATVAHGLQKGLKSIGWHCWDHNVASWKVAEKVGFHFQQMYDAYICFTGEGRYQLELGLAAARKGNHEEALTWYANAKDDPWAHFLAARSYATMRQYPETINALKQAAALGWNDPDYLMNEVFVPLHDTPEWKAIVYVEDGE